MIRKLNQYDRKRLLEEQQSGASRTNLKRMFGIKDNRTLDRQIKLAMEEEQVWIVKSEIIKDALVAHTTEVSMLIGEWKSNISTPRAGSVYYGMPLIPTQNIENNPLFGSLREHLPFPTFWRDYATWKNKVRAYIEGCQEIMKEIGEAEKRSVSEDIYKEWGAESTSKALGLSEPLNRMMGRYNKAVETKSALKSLSEQLISIETKLHMNLQEIQLRRDHIMYTCKLCPGRSRLSR